jgi:hypothetical protein
MVGVRREPPRDRTPYLRDGGSPGKLGLGLGVRVSTPLRGLDDKREADISTPSTDYLPDIIATLVIFVAGGLLFLGLVICAG